MNYLQTLLNTISKDSFLQNYRTNTHVVIDSPSEGLKDLTELDFLKSIDDLISFWPTTIDSYQDGVADEVNSITTNKEKAQELFKSGKSLIFNDANNHSEKLEQWAHGLRADLGLSNLTYSRSLLYAVPTGTGTDPHFDQNINFVIQLKGTKTWMIARNKYVANPLTRYTIGTEMDPELQSYAKKMPTEFPSEYDEVTLTPGSILFVPRGSWHTTKAGDEDTLALNFTYSSPSWIDLLSAALRGRLAQSPYWRETADFVNDEENVNEAISKLNLLISELAHDIPSWKAEDIIGATEMTHHQIRDN